MSQRFTFNFFSASLFAIFFVYVAACSSNDINGPVDCTLSDLAIAITTQTNPTGCATEDGSISVQGSGGKGSYLFSINGDPYVETSIFSGLGGGTYTIKIKDGNSCERSVDAKLSVPGSTLAATLTNTADSQCLTNNGKIVVTASGGSSPYQYRLGLDAFVSTSTFEGLKEGNYSVTIKDNAGCTLTLSSAVVHGNTGVSFASDINPILQAKCQSANCHGSGSINGDWTKYSAVNSKAILIKTRTGDKSMPKEGSLTAEQIALIACWVDDGALNN